MSCICRGSGWYLRGDTIVCPEASEDLDVRKVNLPQELGELFLGQENTTGGVLCVYSILRWDEEFNAGSFCGPCKGHLLIEYGRANGAEHNIDTPEDSGNGSFVRIVNLGELSTVSEKFWIGRLDGVLLSEKVRTRQEDDSVAGILPVGGVNDCRLTEREMTLTVFTTPEAL